MPKECVKHETSFSVNRPGSKDGVEHISGYLVHSFLLRPHSLLPQLKHSKPTSLPAYPLPHLCRTVHWARWAISCPRDHASSEGPCLLSSSQHTLLRHLLTVGLYPQTQDPQRLGPLGYKKLLIRGILQSREPPRTFLHTHKP